MLRQFETSLKLITTVYQSFRIGPLKPESRQSLHESSFSPGSGFIHRLRHETTYLAHRCQDYNTLHSRPISTSIGLRMADDTSYSTFLARANQDPRSGHEAEGESTSQARSKFDPSSNTSSNEAIPSSLRGINVTFVSDTDSDFEPMFFSYASDSLPSTDEFKKVLGVKGENARHIEEVSQSQFDPRGEYKDVVERVKEAGKEARGKRGKGSGEDGARIFRVQVDGTRVEYYVISVGERSLVGVVAKAVES